MTHIKKIDFDGKEIYSVIEHSPIGLCVKYCTLEEVLYILSTPEWSDKND